MKADAKLHALFPTPVYESALDRQFTKQEINFVKQHYKQKRKNEGNTRSIESYVLNKTPLKNMKKFLEEQCQRYLEVACSPKGPLKLYITQSWFNYTHPNQFHHKHAHPNSFISGILYISADENVDLVRFYNPRESLMFSIEPKNIHLCNAKNWWFKIKTGQLLMFPSSLAHAVDIKKGTNSRISLSFNTFIKGVLGDNSKLTELKL